MNNDFVRTLLAILLSGCGWWMFANSGAGWVIALVFSIPLFFIIVGYVRKKLGVE